MDQMLERVARRLQLMVGLGKVAITKDDGNAQLGQVQLSAAETRDDTPMLTVFGVISNPPPDSDVVYINMGGERSKALVIGTNHQPSRHRNAPVGAGGAHDQSGSFLILTNDGNGTLTLSGTPGLLTINGNVQLNGSLTMTGTIHASGTITSDANVVAVTTDLLGHKHTSEDPGSPTSPPIAGT